VTDAIQCYVEQIRVDREDAADVTARRHLTAHRSLIRCKVTLTVSFEFTKDPWEKGEKREMVMLESFERHKKCRVSL